jgi:hypothetical protein
MSPGATPEGASAARLGIQFILGERIREMLANTARNVAEGRTAMIEVLASKPG